MIIVHRIARSIYSLSTISVYHRENLGGHYIDQLFCNTLHPQEHPYFSSITSYRISAHLLLDRHGEITQYVPFNMRAWHAGESYFSGRKRCNDFSIGIELEGTDDLAYTDIQYQTLAEVTHIIMNRWPSITQQRIVGHCDIAPNRKTDPGPAFDWDYYYSCIEQVNTKK